MASTSSSSSIGSDGLSADIIGLALAYKPFNGSLMIAVNLTWLFYGCYLVQAYHFFNSGLASQSFALGSLVALVTFTGALHISFGTAYQWETLVAHWGDPAAWMKTPWPASVAPFTTSLNGFIVQLFFCNRILLLSNHFAVKVSAVAIAAIATLALAGSIAMMTLFAKHYPDAPTAEKLALLSRLWSISTLVCDVLIALTMSLILFSARSRTNYKSMRRLLANLVLQSIETGTITAVNMALFLICYETTFSTGVWLVWEYVSGSIYGNILLFVLNSMRTNRVSKQEAIPFTSPSSILRSRDLISTSWTRNRFSVSNPGP